MYTLLRVLFVVLSWLLIQLVTPVRGLWAIALAIAISAVFSILFLGRQRDAMSGSLYGFFRRINERIDAASAKEDYDDELDNQTEAVIIESDSDSESDSESESESDSESDSGSESETSTEGKAVNEKENPGRL